MAREVEPDAGGKAASLHPGREKEGLEEHFTSKRAPHEG